MSNETKVKIASVGRGFEHRIETRGQVWASDEPIEAGGTDKGPTPYELLLSALGSCSAITMRMYAKRKDWPLEDVEVDVRLDRVHAKDCEDCDQESGMADVFRKEIVLSGPLDDQQRKRLIEIGDRCPVHRALSGGVKIRSVEKVAKEQTEPSPMSCESS